jgi:hypothetical protein
MGKGEPIVIGATVTCSHCHRTNVRIDREGYMKVHRMAGRKSNQCSGSGRHVMFTVMGV